MQETLDIKLDEFYEDRQIDKLDTLGYSLIYFMLEKLNARRVLELGYGESGFLEFLDRKGYDVYGIDSGMWHGQLRDYSAFPNIRKGDILDKKDRHFIEDAVAQDGKFDAIFSRAVLVDCVMYYDENIFRNIMNVISDYSDVQLHHNWDCESFLTIESIREFPRYDEFNVFPLKCKDFRYMTLYMLKRQ